jgi:hypothetical protein
MKYLVLASLLVSGFNAFAGSTTIYCEGNKVQMQVPGKGPRPYPMNGELYANAPFEYSVVVLRHLHTVEDRNSYDYTLFYQNKDKVTSYAAVLSYLQGQHTFKVFKNGQLLEDINCRLGF